MRSLLPTIVTSFGPFNLIKSPFHRRQQSVFWTFYRCKSEGDSDTPPKKRGRPKKKKDESSSNENSSSDQLFRSPSISSAIMTKVLNVAEKPSAAKTIASILSKGGFQTRNGVAQYNKVFEFEVDQFHPAIRGTPKVSMMMTSVSGHMLNYDFSASHRSWMSCDPVTLFNAPVEKGVTKDMGPVLNNLKNSARFATHLIIWTDCDREGENIGYEVIDTVKQVKPNITVFRAKFSELTARSIFTSLKNLIQPDKRASDAVDVRQQLDLRIGAAFTRFQTMYLKKQGIEPPDKVISYGSCQFPTLGFIVDRYLERENFVIQPFWHIDLSYNKNGTKVDFKWSRNRLDDIHKCLDIYIRVLERPVTATVLSVDLKPKSKWRPLPMDTVSFEKLASQKLRMSAKKAMQIAEKLYTQGFISYPRTETNQFPPSLDLGAIVNQQTESNRWGDFSRRLQQEGITPRKGNKSDGAHPPIYPTKFTNVLNGEELKVYELITRHFLACCHKDAKGYETTVKVGIKEETWSATGLLIVERNYLDVYPYDKWTDKELPEFRVGETFTPDELMMNEGKTTPPSLLTESDLIALMEKHGIGTDATHADHIQTIQDRKYVTKTHDRRFLPLPLGLGLIQGYHLIKQEMCKPKLRADLEKDLQEICEGKKDAAIVLSHQINMYKSVFTAVTQRQGLLATTIKDSISRHQNIVDDNENNPPNSPPNAGGRGGGRRDLGFDGFHMGGDVDGGDEDNDEDFGGGRGEGPARRGRGRGNRRGTGRSSRGGRTRNSGEVRRGTGYNNRRNSSSRGSRRGWSSRGSSRGRGNYSNRGRSGNHWTASEGENSYQFDDIDFGVNID